MTIEFKSLSELKKLKQEREALKQKLNNIFLSHEYLVSISINMSNIDSKYNLFKETILSWISENLGESRNHLHQHNGKQYFVISINQGTGLYEVGPFLDQLEIPHDVFIGALANTGWNPSRQVMYLEQYSKERHGKSSDLPNYVKSNPIKVKLRRANSYNGAGLYHAGQILYPGTGIQVQETSTEAKAEAELKRYWESESDELSAQTDASIKFAGTFGTSHINDFAAALKQRTNFELTKLHAMQFEAENNPNFRETDYSEIQEEYLEDTSF